MIGVDVSQWGGELGRETVECWEGQGVEFCVVQYSGLMRQHLQTLSPSRILSEAYVYLYWGTDPWGQSPQDRTAQALEICADFDVKRLWLDAEDTTHPYLEWQLEECVNLCHEVNVPTGIYTAPWWWIPETLNSARFKDLPLWHAEYVVADSPTAIPDATIPWSSFGPYGGWTKPHTWQFQNTTMFCGMSVDVNSRLSIKGGTMGGVFTRPNTNRNYWLIDGKLVWLPNPTIREKVLQASSHGAQTPQPVAVDEDTWNWLSSRFPVEE